jgi:hypothetical protein
MQGAVGYHFLLVKSSLFNLHFVHNTAFCRYPVVSFVNEVHTASAPAPEHYELIGAIRNIWTNPGRSGL